MAKIILRIKGGLGNQLFSYATARRIAVANGAELVIDPVTGFIRDATYRRVYELDRFPIQARSATKWERMEPMASVRHRLRRTFNRLRRFEERKYLVQEAPEFDCRMLDLRVEGTLYLEGYWQSERYFSDIAAEIRSELSPSASSDRADQAIAQQMQESESVAIHVRWFKPSKEAVRGTIGDLPAAYYQRAIQEMERVVAPTRYFLFSDNPAATAPLLDLPGSRLHVVMHDRGVRSAVDDLWLMTRCKHFITANSTFSWWGAWLGEREGSRILTPDWGFDGLIPSRWQQI